MKKNITMIEWLEDGEGVCVRKGKEWKLVKVIRKSEIWRYQIQPESGHIIYIFYKKLIILYTDIYINSNFSLKREWSQRTR